MLGSCSNAVIYMKSGVYNFFLGRLFKSIFSITLTQFQPANSSAATSKYYCVLDLFGQIALVPTLPQPSFSTGIIWKSHFLFRKLSIWSKAKRLVWFYLITIVLWRMDYFLFLPTTHKSQTTKKTPTMSNINTTLTVKIFYLEMAMLTKTDGAMKTVA